MSKAKVNAVLKTFGFGNIKQTVNFNESKSFKNWEGKMVKGVSIVSHSPMDCFSKDQKISEKLTKIRAALSEAGFVIRDDFTVIVAANSKRLTIMSLDLQRVATYHHSANMDMGYKTTYMVPTYTTEEL